MGNEKHISYPYYRQEDVISMIRSLTHIVEDIKANMGELLVENRKLREEINMLKDTRIKHKLLKCNDFIGPKERETSTKNSALSHQGSSTDLAPKPFSSLALVTVSCKGNMEDLSQSDSAGFKEVVYKKKNIKGSIQGTGKNNTSSLKAATHKSYLYAGNFDLKVTSDQVLSYLRRQFPKEEFVVEALPKRERAKSVAFKTIINRAMFSAIMNGDIWPKAVKIRKFHFCREQQIASGFEVIS